MSWQSDFWLEPDKDKAFKPLLTASLNHKGVMDVDTIKGCEAGMTAYPEGGCYGECYACKIASRYGYDFSKSVRREMGKKGFIEVFHKVKTHTATWYRIGTMGDPSHDWEYTARVCEALMPSGKTPVIITKHWQEMPDDVLGKLKQVGAVVNTSVSGMDNEAELVYRLGQIDRLERAGVVSVCRVVTCQYGDTAWGRRCNEIQMRILSTASVIDTPLRVSKNNLRLQSGDIKAKTVKGAIAGRKFISLHDDNVYTGYCVGCPDQCGVKGGMR